jgi:hypothetical protein
MSTMSCLPDDTIELTFVNETSTSLCFDVFGSSSDSCNEVDPNASTVWKPECGGNQVLPVTLTIGPGGPLVYDQSATCREWEESGGVITVESVAGEIVVMDSLD